MLPKPLAVAAIALLAAGCGSGGSQTGKGPPPTRASFAAAAERVCRDAKTHRARIAGLRKLRPPLAERDIYDHWLGAERLAVAAADALERGSKSGEKEDPVVQLAIAQGKIAGYARRLDAGSCAEPPGVMIPS